MRLLELVEQIVFPLWVGLIQPIEDPDRTKRLRKGDFFLWTGSLRSGLLLCPALLASTGLPLPPRCPTQSAGGIGDSFVPIAIRSDFPLPGMATNSSSAPAPPPWECSHRGSAVPGYGEKGERRKLGSDLCCKGAIFFPPLFLRPQNWIQNKCTGSPIPKI